MFLQSTIKTVYLEGNADITLPVLLSTSIHLRVVRDEDTTVIVRTPIHRTFQDFTTSTITIQGSRLFIDLECINGLWYLLNTNGNTVFKAGFIQSLHTLHLENAGVSYIASSFICSLTTNHFYTNNSIRLNAGLVAKNTESQNTIFLQSGLVAEGNLTTVDASFEALSVNENVKSRRITQENLTVNRVLSTSSLLASTIVADRLILFSSIQTDSLRVNGSSFFTSTIKTNTADFTFLTLRDDLRAKNAFVESSFHTDFLSTGNLRTRSSILAEISTGFMMVSSIVIDRTSAVFGFITVGGSLDARTIQSLTIDTNELLASSVFSHDTRGNQLSTNLFSMSTLIVSNDTRLGRLAVSSLSLSNNSFVERLGTSSLFVRSFRSDQISSMTTSFLSLETSSVIVKDAVRCGASTILRSFVRAGYSDFESEDMMIDGNIRISTIDTTILSRDGIEAYSVDGFTIRSAVTRSLVSADFLSTQTFSFTAKEMQTGIASLSSVNVESLLFSSGTVSSLVVETVAVGKSFLTSGSSRFQVYTDITFQNVSANKMLASSFNANIASFSSVKGDGYALRNVPCGFQALSSFTAFLSSGSIGSIEGDLISTFSLVSEETSLSSLTTKYFTISRDVPSHFGIQFNEESVVLNKSLFFTGDSLGYAISSPQHTFDVGGSLYADSIQFDRFIPSDIIRSTLFVSTARISTTNVSIIESVEGMYMGSLFTQDKLQETKVVPGYLTLLGLPDSYSFSDSLFVDKDGSVRILTDVKTNAKLHVGGIAGLEFLSSANLDADTLVVQDILVSTLRIHGFSSFIGRQIGEEALIRAYGRSAAFNELLFCTPSRLGIGTSIPRSQMESSVSSFSSTAKARVTRIAQRSFAFDRIGDAGTG